MALHTDLKESIKDAMRAKDALRLTVLRAIVTAFTNELVAQRKMPSDVLDDDAALAVIKRLVKQRKDSIEQFTAGGRPELAQTEQDELVILEAFLPAMMTAEQIRPIAEKVKAELNVTDKAKIGILVGAVMKACAGKADGSEVKKVVEALF